VNPTRPGFTLVDAPVQFGGGEEQIFDGEKANNNSTASKS